MQAIRTVIYDNLISKLNTEIVCINMLTAKLQLVPTRRNCGETCIIISVSIKTIIHSPSDVHLFNIIAHHAYQGAGRYSDVLFLQAVFIPTNHFCERYLFLIFCLSITQVYGVLEKKTFRNMTIQNKNCLEKRHFGTFRKMTLWNSNFLEK